MLSRKMICAALIIAFLCVVCGNVAQASPTPIVNPDDAAKTNKTKGRPWPYNPTPSVPLAPNQIKEPEPHTMVPWIIAGTLGGVFVLIFAGFAVHYVKRRRSDVQAALLESGPQDYNTSFNASGQMIVIEPNDCAQSPGWGSFPHRIRRNEPESPESPWRDAEAGQVTYIQASGTLGAVDQSQSSVGGGYQTHL